MAYRRRAESRSRSPERRTPSVMQRIGQALASPFATSGPAQRAASEGVGRALAQHGGGRSSSFGATGGGITGQDIATRFGPLASCYSCGETLASQLAEQCRACGKPNHTNCFGDYEASESHTAYMCLSAGVGCHSGLLLWKQ